MMPERCEPCSFIPAGNLPYPLQRALQVRGPNVGALPWLFPRFLASCPFRVVRIQSGDLICRNGFPLVSPLGSTSSASSGAPQPLFKGLSYYGPVRLPASVRRCRAPCGFTARTPPLRTRCGTSRLPCMSLGVRAQGLGPRRGGTALAITICSVLPSVPYDAVGPPKSIFLSRLNIQPARLPVNASPLCSREQQRMTRGQLWFATPWLGGTCTRETYRFVPAHRMVQIVRRARRRPVEGR